MNWLPYVNFFDLIILLIFIILIARGFWIGFVRQIAFIMAMALGFIMAGRFYENFYQYIQPVINNSQVAFIISYIILFATIYYSVALIGLGLKMVMDIVLLGWFDRIAGGLMGAAKALFIASLLFITLSGILASSNNFLRKSFSYPYLSYSSDFILQFIEDNNLRSRFKLKEPAIKPPPIEQQSEPPNDTIDLKKERGITL